MSTGFLAAAIIMFLAGGALGLAGIGSLLDKEHDTAAGLLIVAVGAGLIGAVLLGISQASAS